MKVNIVECVVTAFLLLTMEQHGRSQGTIQFVNLDFESPVTPLNPNDPTGVPIANALPGWVGYVGTGQVNRVFYNTIAIASAAISLQGPESSMTPIDGNYSVFLQAASPSAPPPGVAGIAQSGEVPANAQSLVFFASLTSLQVTFNGQSVPFMSLGNGPNYTIYGGDISAFAGQTGELRFTCLQLGSGAGSAFAYLDFISFSPVPIPEPNAFGLFAMGGLLLGWRFVRKG